MNFSYNVQVSHRGDRGPWITVAKTIDEHIADVLAFALHSEGHQAIRVRQGTRIISGFPHGGSPFKYQPGGSGM